MTPYLNRFREKLLQNKSRKLNGKQKNCHYPKYRGINFVFKFIISQIFRTCIMSNKVLAENNYPINHIHIFREGLTEFAVCTPSDKWCWKTFLDCGITEYPILKFIAIYKSNCGRPPTIKLYTKQELVS